MNYNNLMRFGFILFLLAGLSVWGEQIAIPSADTTRFHKLAMREGLADDEVHTLFQDRAGFIWIGTLEGISRFDGHRFLTFRDEEPPGTKLSSPMIFCFYQDRHHRLLAGAGFGGLNRYFPDEVRFEPFPVLVRGSDSAINRLTVFDMQEDSDGGLWLGTYGAGLFRWHPDEDTLLEVAPGQTGQVKAFKPAIRDLILLDKHTLGVATANQGIFEVDLMNRRMTRLSIMTPEPEAMNHVFKLLPGSDWKLWAGTSQGLFLLSRGKKSSAWTARQIFPNQVAALIRDQENRIWAGGEGGLVCCSPSTSEKTLFTHQPDNPDSLSSNRVTALFEDRLGVIWVGTDSGLNLYSPFQNRFARYHGKSVTSVPVSVLKQANGTQWIRDEKKGLSRLVLGQEQPIPIKIDRDGRRSLRSALVTDLLVDHLSRVWVATDWGLHRWCEETQDFEQYLPAPLERESLRYKSILKLYEDRHNQLWVGTYGGGLFRFEEDQNRFKAISIPGYPTHVVYDICEDQSGFLWLTTTRNLMAFDPRYQQAWQFGKEDGIVGVDQTNSALSRRADGTLVLQAGEGEICFHPGKFFWNPVSPVPVLTSLQLAGRQVKIEEGSSDPHLVISAGEGPIRIQMSAMDAHIASRIRYEYRLLPDHNSWQVIDGEPELLLGGLAPGSYQVECRSKNHDGIVSKVVNLLKIRVKPHFWQTIWFKLLLGILLVFAGYGIHIALQNRRLRRMEHSRRFDFLCARDGLTEREKEIVALILQGKGNKEIEDALFISISTVKNHVHNIFQKASVKSRVQLIQKFEGK